MFSKFSPILVASALIAITHFSGSVEAAKFTVVNATNNEIRVCIIYINAHNDVEVGSYTCAKGEYVIQSGKNLVIQDERITEIWLSCYFGKEAWNSDQFDKNVKLRTVNVQKGENNKMYLRMPNEAVFDKNTGLRADERVEILGNGETLSQALEA